MVVTPYTTAFATTVIAVSLADGTGSSLDDARVECEQEAGAARNQSSSSHPANLPNGVGRRADST
jgi:hypothetical protein